jgi:arsenate reductase
MELWHNPRCSKSRATKEILDAKGVEYVERRYLEDPPSAEELGAALDALGCEPWDIARMGEDAAKELGLADWEHDRVRWIEAMVAHPVLIERPIVLTADGRAAVGRPPESVLALL